MEIKNVFSKVLICLIILTGIDYLPVYAQKQKTKVTIIKETYDDQGNKTVQTIIKEGAEAEAIDLDKLGQDRDEDHSIQWHYLNPDSLPVDGQLFNYSFKTPLDIRSFFDSLSLDGFHFFDQEDFPFLDEFNFDKSPDDKPKLGVRISELDNQSGVLVNNVMPDTPADLAGIREGDIILSIDQQKIEAPADLVNYLQTRSAGEEVTLDILRKGDYLEIRVKLSETQLKKELDIRKI